MKVSADARVLECHGLEDVLKRKPRNPKEKFMNKKMTFGIMSGGITLAAIVLVVYLFYWFGDGEMAAAQTSAFVIWLFVHVTLAFHMRTRYVPLTKNGIFSSRAFNVWICGVVVFLAIALNIPILREYLQLTSIGVVTMLVFAAIAIIATSWMEIYKVVTYNHHDQSSNSSGIK